MLIISSQRPVRVGDTVWGRVYTGDGNKPRLVKGEIVSFESDCYTASADIETRTGEIYHFPANVLHTSKPKAITVRDEFGEVTIWEG